ncbi:MAG: hypothetical protein IPN74_17900 [Haliscomenobacter sp.]|nr:hypothetical protein [Haliscomenobacter sp.]
MPAPAVPRQAVQCNHCHRDREADLTTGAKGSKSSTSAPTRMGKPES